MEERRFSPEQPEEVIELLDIVESSGEEENAGRTEKSVSDVETDATAGTPFSLDETGQSVSEEVEEFSDKAPVRILEEKGDDADDASETCTESPEMTSESDAPVERKDEATSSPAEASSEESAESRALRERYEAEIHTLEERIASLEQRCTELADNVESLSQQLAQVGTMFLEDASVRLSMEEMVSHMLDARMPSSVDQEDAPDGSDLLTRMESLEKRMQDWEEKGDQRAAAAAARVIRDEIAAMRADAHTASH